MSSVIEISDDDDSFDPVEEIILSDDEETKVQSSLEDTPSMNISLEDKKTKLIKELFQKPSMEKSVKKEKTSPGVNKMIGGVNVNLPVNPYGCQIAIMSKVITAIQKKQNCLLESPTGSGKTLALLCGSLAWLKNECDLMKVHGPKWPCNDQPEVKKENNTNPDASFSPEKSFNKPIFGEKTIYDKPVENGGGDTPEYGVKRETPLQDSFEECNQGEVTIHKKQRRNSAGEASTSAFVDDQDIEQHMNDITDAETEQPKRLPTIYYGARTHKQIEQVIKEFRRTWYCGEIPMSLLSSREYSCIREYDKSAWSSKNDMCRSCTTTGKSKDNRTKDKTECEYYNNKKALSHDNMPPAFDIEDLVRAGHEKTACPYYAARDMAQKAHIVFCPYNYLIEPSIRSNMSISLNDNIVIIDEGHNIEDVCRDAASFTINQMQIRAALKDLEGVTKYQYEHSNIMRYVEGLITSMKNWNDWFTNNESWLTSQEGCASPQHVWDVGGFVQSLSHHNIGPAQYNEFKENATSFCRRLREEPRSLLYVSQDTGTLLEAIDAALGYLFESNCEYMDDFKPILETTTIYIKRQSERCVSLRLICLNPARIFRPLARARCVILASGTLAPIHSLKSELGADFPLCISPSHVVHRDRVWVGTLRSTAAGGALRCTHEQLQHAAVLASLGRAVQRVCAAVPHGVLCFISSYSLLDRLVDRWKLNGIWDEITKLKHVFKEARDVKKHNEIMEDYYECSASDKGALLFAVYRGKVSEGMDFKDHQARAVIAIGIPYPNIKDEAVKAKKQYNDKYQEGCPGSRGLLSGEKWYKIQAYRALNQAVGRCVRHREDWGAVLLLDERFTHHADILHLSKWVQNFLGDNHHTFESLFNSQNGLIPFIERMSLLDSQSND